MAIVVFFSIHYLLSIFSQTFFLHRYASHRMFTMSKVWERFFHFLTYVSQGASYLNPRAYALMHRLHHAYSDTERDPHSPTQFKNVMTMMVATKKRYDGLLNRMERIDERFKGGYPEWPLIDQLSNYRWPMLMWLAFYLAMYIGFADAAWQWLLLPIQFLMGPFHGAIVNWCGHKYGYRNFAVSDQSRNTLFFDVVCMGELFQNNHHRYCSDPNFAKRWFEIDPCFAVIRLLAFVGIIQWNKVEVPYEAEDADGELSWGAQSKEA